MKKHSRWRFLLNTDGHTASSRLGHLLGLNSVVLKEKSPWIEYFYRALDPGQDHILFETHNLLPLLKELRVGVGLGGGAGGVRVGRSWEEGSNG